MRRRRSPQLGVAPAVDKAWRDVIGRQMQGTVLEQLDMWALDAGRCAAVQRGRAWSVLAGCWVAYVLVVVLTCVLCCVLTFDLIFLHELKGKNKVQVGATCSYTYYCTYHI